MPRASEPRTVTERFADLLQRAELSDAYQIDRLKVEISERIYNAMTQQDISNAELSRRLGKSRAYVTKLLRGTTNFTLESLVRISRALSCEVEFELLPKAPKAKARAASAAAWETHSAKLQVRQPTPSFERAAVAWVSEPREEFSFVSKPTRQVAETNEPLAVTEAASLKEKKNACLATAA
jgi:transcriptional regulator with XRE-family HTH domain